MTGWALFGKALLVLLPLAALVGIGYWRGYASASTHYKALVDACITARNTAQSANEKNQETITTLRDENRRWAKAAQVNHHAFMAAAQEVDAMKRDVAAAQAKSQHALKEAIDATPDARTWADARVPDAVADQLRDTPDAR